jgi:hypothetical protein
MTKMIADRMEDFSPAYTAWLGKPAFVAFNNQVFFSQWCNLNRPE